MQTPQQSDQGPRCEWCGKASNGRYCTPCAFHADVIDEIIDRTALGTLPRVIVEIGKLACWREQHGKRFVYGRHDLLVDALQDGRPVALRDGEQVRVEHVSPPNSDGFAWGTPLGTRRPLGEPESLGRTKVRKRKPQVRRHNQVSNNRRKRSRMR